MRLKWCFVLLPFFLLLARCASETCTSTGTIHDKEHNVCLVKARYSCLTYPNCVQNAYCDKSCKCRAGFYESSDGRCVHGYKGTCMATGDCDNVDKELKCGPTGQCICPFPDQYYAPKTKGCFGVYDGNCSDVVACESNFVCKNKTCLCPEGLDLTITRKECSSGFEKVCNKHEDCDSSRLLLCQQGKCSCQYPLQEYNYNRGICVGLEGAHCNISNKDNYLDLFCAEGTTCQAITGSSWVGMCKTDDSVSLARVLLAILIFIVFGLVAYLMIFREELQHFDSHHAPALTMDDLERATTATLLSFDGTPPPTPLTSAALPKSPKENRSLTINTKGIGMMVCGQD